jgi:hypothetical protein
LNKQEALNVLHEIYDACRESFSATSVSLDEKQVEPFGSAYQIRMKGDFDVNSRQLIETILGKRMLCLQEEKGYMLIF